MALNSLLCADVPLRNYSLTHCCRYYLLFTAYTAYLSYDCLCLMVKTMVFNQVIDVPFPLRPV